MENKDKLTKEAIEILAYKLADALEDLDLASDTRIYYNNKAIDFVGYGDNITRKTIENINPHDYFEYCAYDHILSVSTEGALYDFYDMLGMMPARIEKLFKSYGLYYEFGDSWNFSLYPIDSSMEVEYTKYERAPEPEYIYLGCKNLPPELEVILNTWYNYSENEGDKGACVIGARMEFDWRGTTYHMAPASPYQGEGSWVPSVDKIKTLLAAIGATNIIWRCGMLD